MQWNYISRGNKALYSYSQNSKKQNTATLVPGNLSIEQIANPRRSIDLGLDNFPSIGCNIINVTSFCLNLLLCLLRKEHGKEFQVFWVVDELITIGFKFLYVFYYQP